MGVIVIELAQQSRERMAAQVAVVGRLQRLEGFLASPTCWARKQA
jgi:hypothetical protein